MSTRGLEVTRTIREGIAEGLYRGGSRMNEAEIATRFGVSRTPVRSALSVLAAEGLLDYTPNAGYTVRLFTSDDIAKMFRVRIRLEGLAARIAAENGLTREDRQRLADIITQTQTLVDRGEWDEDIRSVFLPLNREFHEIIRNASQNPFLITAIQKTNEIPLFNLIRWRWFNADLLRQTQDEHRELYDALINQQPDRADTIQGEHTYRSGRRMLQHWSRTEDEIRAGHSQQTAHTQSNRN